MPRVLYAWWYLSIALGFLLLGIRSAMVGAATAGTVLRFIIAAGFGLLSYFEFQRNSRGQ